MRAFYRAIRIFAAVTLFFFCWTYLPLYAAVAYAATPKEPGATKKRNADSGLQNGNQRPKERFEKAVEAIRERIGKAEERSSKNQDIAADVSEIKVRRAEIEAIDGDLRKEFAATEKKLKNAHLPKEILDRHYKFVKHYDDNLAQLKSELDDLDKATRKADKSGMRKALASAKDHLERVKAPRKHKQLDPNNLPFRARKAGKGREPRLDKKQFEKDFPPQNHKGIKTALLPQSTQRTAWNSSPFSKGGHEGDLYSALKLKPVLLAMNDITSDVPFTLPRPIQEEARPKPVEWGRGEGAIQQLAFSDSSPILLAQASDQPTADDLAETPDIQFTQDIQNLAAQLNHNPVQIYNWVRNNIEYAPTYGSIQGADQCLQSKICNDMDTASLLIALLRVSGIYAHYVYGTVDIPSDKAMNWVGGVTDPKMAGTIFATNGVPVTALVSGGTIKYDRIEHVWVNAYIDYIPSRGAVQRQGNTWIPLDASYKQYNYTQGIDISSAVPFDAQTFANQILSTATTNTVDGSVTNVNSAYVQQTMTDYQTQVQNYIQQNYPNATVGDVIGKKEIIQQNYPILLGTLPYKSVQVGTEFATVPDNLRETISFSIPDPTGATAGLTYTTGMPQIAGKKITLSFSPATANDQAVIESLLPQPHADGTPIQPSELPSSFPAYLTNFKPELRIHGQVVATGVSTMMGSAQSFTMSLNEPGIGVSNIDNTVKVGEYFGIGVDAGRIGASRQRTLNAQLAATAEKIQAQTYQGLNKDVLVGDLLYTTMMSYFAELDTYDETIAINQGIIRYRAPSVGIYSLFLNVHEVFRGGPQKSDSRIRCKIRQTIRRPQSNEQSETEAVHS